MPITSVGDAVREMKAGSSKIRTRKQAIAVGLKAQRKRRGKRRGRDRSLSSRRGYR